MAKPLYVTRIHPTGVLPVLFAVAVGATPVFAQGPQPNPSHWGASFSTTPSWDLAAPLKHLIQNDGTAVTVQGSEFTVGLVRGSRRGGDWGVSFVSKPFKNGSSFVSTDQACFQNACLPTTETDVLQGVKLTGVEVHWFIRVANITKRAQVGINLAGGIANVSGTVVKTTDDYTFGGTPQNGRVNVTPTHTVEVKDAAKELFPKFPLMKLELQGTAVLTPSVKATISGGLNFPGVGMRAGLVYLFGAH
jgi:hypothetical protein